MCARGLGASSGVDDDDDNTGLEAADAVVAIRDRAAFVGLLLLLLLCGDDNASSPL